MMRLVAEIEHVDYIKEETNFAGQVITQCVDLAASAVPGKFKGVMGGKAGRYLLDEYRRGACGSMPACEVADVQAKIWDALEAGREDEATEMFNKIITLLNFEYLYGSALYKEVLKARGVIKTANFRQCGASALDEIDHVEFKRIMDYIAPMFKL
jgi:4-hydroxy-tetrahydrodipicolinate synthase